MSTRLKNARRLHSSHFTDFTSILMPKEKSNSKLFSLFCLSRSFASASHVVTSWPWPPPSFSSRLLPPRSAADCATATTTERHFPFWCLERPCWECGGAWVVMEGGGRQAEREGENTNPPVLPGVVLTCSSRAPVPFSPTLESRPGPFFTSPFCSLSTDGLLHALHRSWSGCQPYQPGSPVVIANVIKCS